MRTGVAGGGGAVDVGFHPAIEIVGAGGMADISRGIFRSAEREGLSFAQGGGVLILAEDFDMAGADVDGAAVVKIIEAEGGVRGGLDGEVAAGDAEIIGGGIHVERSGALANNEAGGARAVVEREIVKLEDGVLVEEGHGAIFKFDGGAAAIRGQDVALADRKI